MGPRPDGRGTSIIESTVLKKAPKLQWGRDRMAAERITTALKHVEVPRLQWGRDRMAAERVLPLDTPHKDQRFNGAATGWPRNASGKRLGRAAIQQLQWGRDRMAAERNTTYFGRNVIGRLQWGRDRMAAERLEWHEVGVDVGHASMGPRPDGRGTRTRRSSVRRPSPTGFNGAATGWPRNGRQRTGALSCRYCFNGAATGWPRNDGNRNEGDNQHHASMGPRPDGRGTRGPQGPVGAGGHASMGPRPDGRGTGRHRAMAAERAGLQWGRDRMAAERAPAAPDPNRPWSFNGAATGWPRNATAAGPRAAALGCFNGAATGWPRNADLFRLAATGGAASMGPRPDGRGTGSAWNGTTCGLTCFNGAATGWPRNAHVAPRVTV